MTATRRLPQPRTGVYDWQLQAACRAANSDLFFNPFEEHSARAREQREEQAKALCATCPVHTECLQHALAVAEPYGIWGGAHPRRAQAAPAGRAYHCFSSGAADGGVLLEQQQHGQAAEDRSGRGWFGARDPTRAAASDGGGPERRGMRGNDTARSSTEGTARGRPEHSAGRPASVGLFGPWRRSVCAGS